MDMKYNKIHNISGAMCGVCIAGLLACGQASAQLSYGTTGVTLTEDFNEGLPSGSSTPTWVDNSVFTGWYAFETGTSGSPADYRITSSGNSSAADLYQWRSSASSTDGALGTRPSSSTGDMMLGLRITNNTGMTLTEFTLSYIGEQWFESQTDQNNQFIVSYQIGTVSSLDSGSWTTIDALEYNTEHESGADTSLIGSDLVNQVALSAETISSVVWEDETDIWIRWFDSNSSGFDQGIAIDDVNFSAIPELSNIALLLGGSVFAIASMCRRRKPAEFTK